MSTLTLDNIVLERGSHNPESGHYCLLNAAREFAPACGYEPAPADSGWDDHPSICRVRRCFAIRLNDAPWSSDDARTAALRPAICLLLGTAARGDGQAVAYRLVDAAVREFAPLALEAAGLAEDAAKLRALSPVADANTARAATTAARAAAWAAATTAATTAARAAARDAEAAAWAAARAGDAVLQRAAEILIEVCL